MAAIAGLRGSGDWGTDERPKNFREMILWMSPNGQTPLTALTAKMKKQTTDDPEFAWWEETLTIVRVKLDDATDMSNVDTAVVCDNGALDLKPGDMLLVELAAGTQTANYANEIVRVATVTDDTHFTIVRGQAGSSAASITDNSFFTLIGSAYEEGTGAPAATTRNPTKLYNYTQIFKDSYSITNTAKATYARTGDPIKNDKKRKMFDHSTRMEMAFLFGKRYEIASGAVAGKPQRFTGGLMFFLAANAGGTRVVVKSSAYTAGNMNLFIDDVKDVFDYTGEGATGGDERIVLCGNGFLNVMNQLAVKAGVINFGDIVKVYGMQFVQLVTPQGTFYFKSHPLMNVHPVYTNTAFVIDPPSLYYRPLDGRDTKPDDNIQLPGEDAQKGQWIGEVGLEFHHLQTMKCVTNATWAAS